MKTSKKLIIIDDDPSNNFMCCQVLKKLCSPVVADICSFTFVEKGLIHLEQELSKPDSEVVLFLDINMPLQLSGWEVLDRLTQLPDSMQNRLTVFMLSSSTRPLDKAKATGYRLVKKFVSKPMMTNMTWLKEEIMFDENGPIFQPTQNRRFFS